MDLVKILEPQMEPEWSLRKKVYERDPLSGNLRPKSVTVTGLMVLIQQKYTTGVKEVEQGSTDERTALILPAQELKADYELVSPRGEVWSCTSPSLVRRELFRKPVYTAVTVRRSEEKDV